MEKKYKIILLKDSLPKKTLFKSNVKRNIQHKFKKLGKSSQPLFIRKYVKRKICQFELGLFSLERPQKNIYIKDGLGRNIKRELQLGEYFLINVLPFWVEEHIYDHQTKKRVSFEEFYNVYLDNTNFRQLFTLNNKIIIQQDETIFIFSLKNIDDANRLVLSIKKYLISQNKMNCLIVQDYDTIQRKQLYKMLEKKGFKKTFLYKHYTY
jgi:hypothetical protein